MTSKNSICVKCKHLYASTEGYCVTNNGNYLVSTCLFGGKNAGNRKKCKRFEEANKQTIQKRLNVF